MSNLPKNPPGMGYGNYSGPPEVQVSSERYLRKGLFTGSDNGSSPREAAPIHIPLNRRRVHGGSTISSSGRKSHAPLVFPEPHLGANIARPSPLLQEPGDGYTQVRSTPLERRSSNPFISVSASSGVNSERNDKKQRLVTSEMTRYGTSATVNKDPDSNSGGEKLTTSIILKHGVRLIEAAEIRLEALSTFMTYFTIFLPYLCLGFALWLQISRFNVATRIYPPGTSTCSGSYCEWEITDVPLGNSMLKLEVDLFPSDSVTVYNEELLDWEEFGDVQYFIGAQVEVQVPDDSDWVSIYTQNLDDSWQIVQCTSNSTSVSSTSITSTRTISCDTTILLDLLLDSPGLVGRYDSFKITIDFSVAANSTTNSDEDGAEDLISTASFMISSESELFSEIVEIVREVLLGISVFMLLRWIVASCRKDQKGRFFIAERIWLTFMLLALICWQNPVMTALQYIPVSSYDTLLLLASDSIQVLGLHIMWLSWLVIVCGQRFTRKLRARGGSLAPVPETGKPYAALSQGTPHHHPRSEFFVEFIIFKLFYTFLGICVCLGLAVLRHPQIIPSDWDWIDDWPIFEIYSGLSLCSGLIGIGWVIWFFQAACKTGRILKGHPFMPTRRQQLTYRVMIGQVMLLLLLLGVGFSFQLVEIVIYGLRHISFNDFEATWLGGLGFEGFVLSSWSRQFNAPLGALLFVSCIVCTQVYLFLPPKHSAARKHDRLYVSLEKDMPPKNLTRKDRASMQLKQPLFCLETACFLCEAAWQAYYDPYSADPDDMIAPAKQDLSYLGLKLVAYIYNEETEMRAVLCRGHDRLVLAFRGTAHLKNLATDMKMSQTPLPDLIPKGRGRISIPFPSGSPAARLSVVVDEEKKRLNSNEDDDAQEIEDPREDVDLGELLFSEGVAGLGWHIRNIFKRFLNSIPLARQALPQVHMGFLETYLSVREQAMAAVAREVQKDYKPLYITGHSLGGALACLAAQDITANFTLPDEITLYTYGAPRVGNGAFSRRLNANVPHHFRVVNDGDFFTGMPKFFYRHAGTKVITDSDKSGTFIVEPTIVEMAFGVKSCAFLAVHPLSEYRECIEACLNEDDLQKYISKGVSGPIYAVPDWLTERRKRTQPEG